MKVVVAVVVVVVVIVSQHIYQGEMLYYIVALGRRMK